MGAWAGQTVSQSTYLGWMSNSQGFNYFVNEVLPDVLTGSAKIQNPAGSNLGPVADVPTIIRATNAAGAGLPDGALAIPQATLEAARNPPTPAPVATVTQAPTPAVTDGLQALKDELGAWGLGSLADQAVAWKNAGYDDATIVSLVRGTDTWKQRFSGIVDRQKAGLPAGSESDALAYEQSMHEMLGQYGIANYTPADYQKWYGEDKSVAEMSKRASVASQWTYSEPPEALAAAQRMFGITPDHITANALDTEKQLPEIQKQLDAAAIAGSAANAGLGALTAGQAEKIGMATDPQQAAQQLAALGQTKQLFVGLPGEDGNITLDDVIAGYFGGDADKLAAIRRRAAMRQASFSGTGGTVSSQQGAVGAGVVQPA